MYGHFRFNDAKPHANSKVLTYMYKCPAFTIQMLQVILSSCFLSTVLGFVAEDFHVHASHTHAPHALPGFCNNLDCPKFSVLQTFKVGIP